MRTTSVVATVAAAVLLLAGCGKSDSNSSADASDPVSVPKISKLGPFLGECGHLTDDEVAGIVAQPKFPEVFRNSVGCVWEFDGTQQAPSVSFSWYRGSPIGRESAGSGLIGRPTESIKVQGHPGFRGQSQSAFGDICEIGVQYGDDFFHWSVTYGAQQPTADSCTAAGKLADMTAARAK